ncbi:hypothetical protein HKM21_24615 [Longimicrobium terrae]|uniref:Uncharacterized protein n=2 Tax=Longimicrobium terrae TaxID=1639882 RepID=A0A841H4G2_9BACT|nr:hypothetical protein [Longimicrobium terrae]MBB6072679.1 hypothetical protein [Longimicrobium terrae]NNC32445.1 hypothetical protein [Longimicrobium terrae]
MDGGLAVGLAHVILLSLLADRFSHAHARRWIPILAVAATVACSLTWMVTGFYADASREFMAVFSAVYVTATLLSVLAVARREQSALLRIGAGVLGGMAAFFLAAPLLFLIL